MENQKKPAPDSTEKTTITGNWTTRQVWIGKIELLPDASQKACYHSDEFNWSYGGSGPSQLALAILLEVTQDQSFSLVYYQRFKWSVIAGLPKENFVLPVRTVLDWVDRARRAERADPS